MASELTKQKVLHIVRVNYITYCKTGKNMFTIDNFPRLSHKEFVILEMLINNGEMYGLEMVSVSGGELKRGTIYITLQRMSKKDFIESREEAWSEPEIGSARRKYKITDFGEKVFKAQELTLRYLNMNVRR